MAVCTIKRLVYMSWKVYLWLVLNAQTWNSPSIEPWYSHVLFIMGTNESISLIVEDIKILILKPGRAFHSEVSFKKL